MIHHASHELIEAMRGVPPRLLGLNDLEDHEAGLPECGASASMFDKAALAYLSYGATDVHAYEPVVEDPTPVDCEACLRLLEAARGPERTAELLVYADQLEGVVAAYKQAVRFVPSCERPARLRAEDGLCSGPMVTVQSHGGNHRAAREHRIVCCACGYGREGTDAEVTAAKLPDALEPAAERARAKLATIRAANLFVPGSLESAARRKK